MILACFWVHLYIHILMLNRNLVYQTWIKNWELGIYMLTISVDGTTFMFVGLTRRIICTRSVDGRLPMKSTITFQGPTFTRLWPATCVMFCFISRLLKFVHAEPNSHIQIILHNVNWLFLYFFLRDERCNSDVNTVNGKTKYDVIQRHWIPLTTRTLMLKKQRESYYVHST